MSFIEIIYGALLFPEKILSVWQTAVGTYIVYLL